jgi:transposase
MKQKHPWEITDGFWAAAEPLIPQKQRDPEREYRRKTGGGRKPMEPRAALAAVFYVLRTGIQWKALPADFGSSSSVHRYFQLWCEQGVFQALWKAGLAEYDEAAGIDWAWLNAGGAGKGGKKRDQRPSAGSGSSRGNR